MARGDKEDHARSTWFSNISETGWESITLLQLERDKIEISGSPWSRKSPMDMEPMID